MIIANRDMTEGDWCESGKFGEMTINTDPRLDVYLTEVILFY